MPLTGQPDADALLDALVPLIRGELGGRLVGLYLYGSLVSGGYTDGVSDVDLLAVVTADVSSEELGRLEAMHARVESALPAWRDRVEVAYVSTAALQTFRTERSPIAVISPGEPLHIKDAGRDWTINWWVIREQGVALLGPPPAEVIDPIGRDEFLQAVRRQVEEWQSWVYHMERRKGQAYAVLTMCRALYAHEHGAQVPKQQAAAWAAGRLPAWAPFIEEALAWRVAPSDEHADHQAAMPETVRFVRLVGDIVAGREAPAAA